MQLYFVLIPAAAVAFWVVPNILNFRRLKHASDNSDLSIYYDVAAASKSDHALQELMHERPDHPLPAIRWAQRKHGEWEEMLRRGDIVRAKFPKNAEAYGISPKALINLGQIDRAEADIVAGIKRFPDNFGLRIEYAGLAERREDWPEARRRWAEIRLKFPKPAAVYEHESRVLLKLGDAAAAEALLAEGLDKVQADQVARIHVEYAGYAHDRQDWPEAVRRWEIARALFDTNPVFYLRGAEALRHAGRTQEADELLESAIFLFPRDPEIAGIIAARRTETEQAGGVEPGIETPPTPGPAGC